MAHRFVRARPNRDRLRELRDRLDDGDIEQLEPFGSAMTTALNDARFDPDTDEAVWVEEDYCSPPLAMERAEVLNEYFESLRVVDPDVDPASAWERIEHFPALWDTLEAST
jgi:hypothetical protein